MDLVFNCIYHKVNKKNSRTTGLVAEMLIPRDKNNSVAKEIREKLKNKDEILRQIDEEVAYSFLKAKIFFVALLHGVIS